MRLVNIFVDGRVVFKTMDPVDGDIVENHVEHCRDAEPSPSILAHIVVQQTLAANLSQENRQGQDVDERNSRHGGDYFLANLVLQETRVVLQPAVKDEVVGHGAEDKVEGAGSNLSKEENGDDLAVDIVARPWCGYCGR